MTTTKPKTDTFLCESAAILETLRSYVDSGEQTAMAIAFWGDGACKSLRINVSSRGALRVLLNATSGACNPSELEILLKLNACVEVRSDPQLHAKVALCGKKTLVGSANASANGLGFEGESATRWTEACIETEDDAVSSSSWIWFEALWVQAKKLDENLIEQARTAWRITRTAVRKRDPLGSGDAISPSTLAELPIFIALSCETSDYNEKEAARRAKAEGFDLATIDFYQSWPKIPKQSLLLAYDFNKETKKVTKDGSYRTFESNRAIQLKNGGRIYPVEVVREENWQELGIAQFSHSMLQSLRVPIQSLVAIFMQERKHRKERMTFLDERTSFDSPNDWCIRLDEFLNACEKFGISLPLPFRGIY